MIKFIRILIPLFIYLNFMGIMAQEKISPISSHPSTDLVDDWHLAMQFWTFNKFSFFEAIDKTSELGLSWIEAYPGQQIFAENKDLVFDENLPLEYREQIKSKLKKSGLRLINYGVIHLPDNEEKCRQIFEFAKDMGIKTIISEPEKKTLSMIDSLCQIYDINVALHNHPKPSRYWNPDSVLSAVKGRSKYIGACADLGHWIRSGIQPLVAMKKLNDRILTFHFKDVKDFRNPKASDVLWGRGIADIDLVLEELKNRKYQGVISIEYERKTEKLMSELRTNIRTYNAIAGYYVSFQWQNLLKYDLTNCVIEPGSWKFEDGILSAEGGGDLWTKNIYGNFILDLDFKLAPETNSGVFLRTGDIVEWLHTAIEVQIFDSYNKKAGKHDCGAIFDCLEPAKNMVNPPGEWNKYTITCTGNKIYVVLNGEQIIDMDLNLWTDAGKNPDGSPNKFKTAYKDMPRKGHIGFQYHGHPVWFRNIRIRRLELAQ